MPAFRLALLIVLAAALLAGCGRRGSLESPGRVHTTSLIAAPDQTAAPPTPDQGAATKPADQTPGDAADAQPAPGAPTVLDQTSPGAQEPPRGRASKAPNRPFILDPLL